MSKRTKKKDREERIEKIHDLLMRGKYRHNVKKSPAFQLYVQDFLSGTLDMLPESIGSYVLLLLRQWDKYLLPNNIAKLSVIAKCNPEVIGSILEKFVLCTDGQYRNSRLELVRAEQIDYRNGKSNGGTAAMKNRYSEKEEPKSQDIAQTPVIESGSQGPHYFRIGLELYQMRISDYMKKNMQIYLNAWKSMHEKSVASELIWKSMEEKIGKNYTSEGHIQNTFESIANKIRQEKIAAKPASASIKASMPKKRKEE